jgi:hypothetical protein
MGLFDKKTSTKKSYDQLVNGFLEQIDAAKKEGKPDEAANVYGGLKGVIEMVGFPKEILKPELLKRIHNLADKYEQILDPAWT